jgi:Sulfotransferase domain
MQRTRYQLPVPIGPRDDNYIPVTMTIGIRINSIVTVRRKQARRHTQLWQRLAVLVFIVAVAFIFAPIPLKVRRNLQELTNRQIETTSSSASANNPHGAQRRVTRIYGRPSPQASDPAEKLSRIPTVLLAGTQKAGTSSLAVHLMKHSDLCFSDKSQDDGPGGSFGKEAHFFDNKYRGGLKAYQDLYAHCPDNATLIDATPETMLFPERVQTIYNQHGSAHKLKIIFILREPVAREISWYNHRLRYVKLPEKEQPQWAQTVLDKDGQIRSFIELARETVISRFAQPRKANVYGNYVFWLRRWSKLFDRQAQILVLSYDELWRDPATLLQRVHEFIALSPTVPLALTRENTNDQQASMPPCRDQRELARVFKQPNAQLYQFLETHPGPPMEQRPFPKFDRRCGAVK